MSVPAANTWCDQLAEKCWSDLPPAEKPSIYERYLAMQVEMGRLKDDGSKPAGYGESSGKSISYHSIDQVEGQVNRLGFKYRVTVIPSILEYGHAQLFNTASAKDSRTKEVSIYGELQKPVAKVRIGVEVVNVDDPNQRIAFEWADDGDDLTKAGSFTVKYAYMKLFHVNDGSDEEKTDSKVGGDRWTRDEKTSERPPSAQSKSATTATEPVKAVANQSTPPQTVSATASIPNQNGWTAEAKPDPATDPQKIAALIWYAETLPESEPDKERWGRPRIITEIGMYNKRRRDGQLNENEKQVGDAFRFVFARIRRLHSKPDNCGEHCEHWAPVASVFRMGGEITEHAKQAAAVK